MGVQTAYEDRRNDLRDELRKCLRMAKEMFDGSIWGYDDMDEDYIFNVFMLIKKAKDSI